MNLLTYPDAIKTGDTVGLVLPSSMITEEQLDQAIKAAKTLGLKCKIGRTMKRATKLFTAQQNGTIEKLLPTLSALEQDEYNNYIASGYMAGSPKGRASDINSFFADPSIKSIWCLRGGFGSARIMPYLDYGLIRANPKLILGYSDATNILTGIYTNARLVTYHAPMLVPNWTESTLLNPDGGVDKYTASYFNQFVMSDWSEVTIANPIDQPSQTIVPGKVEGRIVGGNISELAQSVGTNYGLDTDNKIVFLEEVRTHIAWCDCFITQMKNSGVFDNIRGLIIGDFLNCHNRTGHDKCRDWRDNQLLRTHFADARYPVLANMQIGHDKQTATIPLGAYCQLDAGAGTIIISKTD